MSDPRTAEIGADIDAQRDDLAVTVDGFAHKLDVKAQTRERLAVIKGRATTVDGKPRPDLVGGVSAALFMLGLLLWWRWR